MNIAPYTDEKGFLNAEGVGMLVGLLEKLPKEQWGEAFIPLKKRGVHVSTELIIVQEGKVLLTYRHDADFHGWHTPGAYIFQGDDWQAAASRCAGRELGIPVAFERVLGMFNNTDSPRFHDLTVLLLCKTSAKPEGEDVGWFAQCPADLVPVHKKYWPVIAECL